MATDDLLFEIRIRHRKLGDLDDRIIEVSVPYEDAQETRAWVSAKPMMEALMERAGYPLKEYELVHYRNAGRRWG